MIGAVLARVDPPREIASDSARLAWLVTMNVMGPAPTLRGDTDTRESLTYTVMFTGSGGRGIEAALPPVEPHADRPRPQAERTKALSAECPIVLMRILTRLSSPRSTGELQARGPNPRKTLSDQGLHF